MQYEIRPKQDYSVRIGGSWGSIIVYDTGAVDAAFLRDRTCKVVVEDDNDTPLTEEMNADQWYAWKEQNSL